MAESRRTYRDLHPLPLSEAFADVRGRQGCVITMSIGQWDDVLSAAYANGWTLLELDEQERPIAAYRKGQEPLTNSQAQ